MENTESLAHMLRVYGVSPEYTSVHTGVPMSVMTAWVTGERPCPKYIQDLIEYWLISTGREAQEDA